MWPRSTSRRIPACLLIGVLLIGAAGIGEAAAEPEPGSGRAGALAGPALRLSTGPKREVAPAVAFNATDSQYLVVWEDWRDYSGTARGVDLYGRLVGANGTRLPIFRISRPVDTYDDRSPAVAWNANDNEYFMVWVRSADPLAPGRTDEVYGRRIKGDGTFTGPAIRISGPVDFGGVYSPQVAWNRVHNQYLVIWHDYRPGEDDLIYGRRVAANGVLLNAGFPIGDPPATDMSSPVLAFNATRTEYLVVWVDGRNYPATQGYDIYGRRVDADGTLLASDFPISGPNADESEDGPAVAWNADLDQYLVVWEDARDVDSQGWDIYGVRLSGTGTRLSGDVRLVDPDNILDDFIGGLAWSDTSGNYLLAYDDLSLDVLYGTDVYGQRISAQGRRSGQKFRIVPPKGSNEANLTEDLCGGLAWNSVDNEYLVVWMDDRRAAPEPGEEPVFLPDFFDVFARRVRG